MLAVSLDVRMENPPVRSGGAIRPQTARELDGQEPKQVVELQASRNLYKGGTGCFAIPMSQIFSAAETALGCLLSSTPRRGQRWSSCRFKKTVALGGGKRCPAP